MKKIFLLISALMLFYPLVAQEVSNDVNRTQLTLMIVPFTTKGEDIRTKIESDFNYRAAINSISKAFEDRGYTVDDFIDELKSNITSNIGNEGVTQTDLWKKIQENSTVDIFVQTEVYIYKGAGGNKVQILLSAIDKYSGERLASSEMLESNTMFTEDFAKLTVQALTKNAAIDKFLESLNTKFKDISINGRSVELRLELHQTSTWTFDEEVGSDYEIISDIIKAWVKANSFKNNYHVKTISSSLVWFDLVKIPVRNSDNSNYDPDDFKSKFRIFLLKELNKKRKTTIDIKSIGSKINVVIK